MSETGFTEQAKPVVVLPRGTCRRTENLIWVSKCVVAWRGIEVVAFERLVRKHHAHASPIKIVSLWVGVERYSTLPHSETAAEHLSI